MKIFNKNKGIHDLKKIQMSAQEKQKMLSALTSHMENNPIPKATTTWYSWMSFSRLQLVRVGVAVLVLAMSGGVVAAAERSLPGDFLYPVKIHVNESIEGSLKVTPQAKAQFQEKKVVRRLKEAEALAVQGKLDNTTRVQIEREFDKNVKAYIKTNIDAKAGGNANTRVELKQQFESRVSTQLKKIREEKEKREESADRAEVRVKQNIEIDAFETNVMQKFEGVIKVNKSDKDKESEGEDSKVGDEKKTERVDPTENRRGARGRINIDALSDN